MHENLKIVESISNEEWNKLFEKGSSKSIYFHNDFLNSLQINYARYLIYKNNELVAGFVAILDEDKISIVNHELVIYSGFYFTDRATSKINKQRVERMSIIDSVLEMIGNKYSEISFTLSPDLQDMRPFHWHNYHEDSFRFRTEVKYTSYIDLTNSSEVLYSNLSSLRKRQISYAEKENFEIKTSKSFSKFIKNYEENLINQVRPHPYSKNYFNNLYALLKKLSEKKLITQYELIRNGTEAYSVIFSNIMNTTEYLYGTGNKENQKNYDSTYLFWFVMNKMKKDGITTFNFEGVNSPDRGNFKLSFGGSLASYFSVKKI